MSDAALENAQAKRDALATKINSALQQIEEWKRDLRGVEQFILTWHQFAELSEERAPPNAGPEIGADAAPSPAVKTAALRRAFGNPKKEEIAAAVREIISDEEQPLGRSDLYQRLLSRGFVFYGNDPEMVLSTMLWRSKDSVIRLPKFGYWLPELPYAAAGYSPGGAVRPDGEENVIDASENEAPHPSGEDAPDSEPSSGHFRRRF